MTALSFVWVHPYSQISGCDTDNNPLTYVLTTAKLDACGQRWVAKLANYNFTIQYRSGQSNVEADALSRISWPKVLDGTDTVDVENMDTHIVMPLLLVLDLSPV